MLTKGIIYTSGVILGSLFSSIIDIRRPLVGASGQRWIKFSDLFQIKFYFNQRETWIDLCHLNIYFIYTIRGDYCLITTVVANVIMNADHMKWYFALIRFLPVAAYISYDVWQTTTLISAGVDSGVSWSAHLGGAITGLTLGICVLKNFRRMPWEGWLSESHSIYSILTVYNTTIVFGYNRL